MGKKKDISIKIPKRVLGFKLSKGSRKDIRKLLNSLDSPQARTLAVSAASVAIGYLVERTAEHKGPLNQLVRKASALTSRSKSDAEPAGVTKM